VLAATQVSTTQTQLCNFAYLLQYIFQSVPSYPFTSFVIQGGAHAQQWLLKRLDWNNFLTENADKDVEPKYNLFEILEDVCRFWGWTARTYRQTVYLTCADDTGEASFLTLDKTQLSTMAGGTAAGSASGAFNSQTVSGDVYASTDNDDFKQRGPAKATVKADVNEEDTLVEFAPPSVEKQMEGTPAVWRWVQSGGDLVGYFEAQNRLTSFASDIMVGAADATPIRGTNDTHGAFGRRQIYSTAESDKPNVCDEFIINNNYPADKTQPAVSIRTNKAMALKGGSLTLKGEVYFGHYLCDWDMTKTIPNLKMRLGIGPNADRSGIKYFYIDISQSGGDVYISHGWSSTSQTFMVKVNNGQIGGPMLFDVGFWSIGSIEYPGIPVDGSGDFYGFIFVDFYGFRDLDTDTGEFQIANFAIEFSRDTLEIPTSRNVVRARTMKIDRVTTQEYFANNQNQTHEEWNADLIFASDNNMEYGHGLLMNADGSFMETAPYTAGGQHPEQHLANRVANYWATSRRRIGGDFRADVRTAGTSGSYISDVTPQHMLTINGTKFHPVAISRNWRDDVVRLSLLEMP
jgi:hypothetical protein